MAPELQITNPEFHRPTTSIRVCQLSQFRKMKLLVFSAMAAAVCFLSGAGSSCSNNPCTGTDYRSYSTCLSNRCPNTVVATGCPESKCTSINCNTCSSSNACCNSCCSKPSPCECQNIACKTCEGPCCTTCCPQQDCCKSSSRQECCVSHPTQKCCEAPQPVQPVFPSITLPNITIFINQTPAIIYNTLNQTCGGVTTIRNSTHIVTTTSTCSNQTIPPSQPCCRIQYSPPCAPQPFPPFQICPPPVYNYACGPQCIVQQPNSPLLVQTPPQVLQPQVFQPPPIIQPQVFQPPPIIQPQVIQPPPIIQPQVFQPPPIIQPQVFQPPPIIQPQVFQPPPVIRQQWPIYQQGCQYQNRQCPPHCLGGCSFLPIQQPCMHTRQWPFVRCGIGNSYFGGFGSYGGDGGFRGLGGYGGGQIYYS